MNSNSVDEIKLPIYFASQLLNFTIYYVQVAVLTEALPHFFWFVVALPLETHSLETYRVVYSIYSIWSQTG